MLRMIYGAYCNKMRRLFYDTMIASYTQTLYYKFLMGCESGSRILDVGIGNGSALCMYGELIKRLDLHIVGLDICEDSLLECEENIRKNGLEKHVETVHVDDFGEKKYEKFDYAFLSNSYSVIKEIEDVIKMALDMTKNRQCVIALALFDKRSRIKEFIKEKLKYPLGFDCGRFITHSSLTDELYNMGLHVMTKELSCSNKLLGFNLADIYTLKIGEKSERN